MIVETVTKTLLEASAGLQTLVGTLPAMRAYLDNRPEGDALPAIVYVLVSDQVDTPDWQQTGTNQERCQARVQVNCLGSTSESADAVREAVRTAMHGKTGIIGGYVVAACLQAQAGADTYDMLVATYNKPIDFMVHYFR
jgi:hypothetical protein